MGRFRTSTPGPGAKSEKCDAPIEGSGCHESIALGTSFSAGSRGVPLWHSEPVPAIQIYTSLVGRKLEEEEAVQVLVKANAIPLCAKQLAVDSMVVVELVDCRLTWCRMDRFQRLTRFPVLHRLSWLRICLPNPWEGTKQRDVFLS